MQFGRLIDDKPVDRLARTFCMFKCSSMSDCRVDEGYDCFQASQFGGEQEARVLGDSQARFCAPLAPTGAAQRPRDPEMPVDAAMSMPEDDAGMAPADAGEDAMMSLPEDDAG